MRRIQFIPLGELAPDAKAVDSLQLRRSTGLLPLHGKYRSLPILVERTSEVTPYPVNGSHPHLITPVRSNQDGQPIADEPTQEWDSYGDDNKAPEGASTAANWWRLVSPVDELTGIRLRPGVSTPGKGAFFDLPDLDDPNTNEGHILRVRYRVIHEPELNNWFLNFRLRQQTGGIIVDLFYDTTNYPGGNAWITLEHTLTPAEVALITDYNELKLDALGSVSYPGTVNPIPIPLVAIVNEGPGEWEKEPDDDEVTKVQILEDGDSATYLKQTGSGGTLEALLFDIVPPADPANPGTNWKLFADVGSPTEALDVTLKLLEAGSVVSETTQAVAAGPPTPISYTIPEADLVDVEDWNSISVRVDVVSQSPGAAILLRPNATDQADSEWTPVGGSTIHGVVGDNDINTYAIIPENWTGGDLKFRVGLPAPGTAPADGTPVTVKARVTGIEGRNEWRLRFGSGTTTHFSQSFPRQDGTNNLIQATSSPSGVDWSDAWIQVEQLKKNNDPRQSSCLEVWVESNEPASDFESQVAEIGLASPTEIAGLEICFMEYDLPISQPLTPGDRAQVYAGNERSIYEVGETSGFQDVSKTDDASYGQQTGSITGWRFASWGNSVVATNGSDPIQWQENAGERFVDLLDTGVEPDTEVFTARYVAVARDFLFTANCLHPSLTEISEFVVWWSAINNPRLFKQLDLTTMSDYQPLVTTSGSVTGLVGGDFITIYKRNSIYRGTFVGPPIVWDIQLVSYYEGTMYPSSIVSVDRDQFFFGNGGFRHLPFGSGVRPIGDGKVTKMFVDKLYEDRALLQFDSTDLREIENSLIGCYEPWTRVLFWLYRGLKDNQYRNRMGIIYNPWEDRWSILDLPFTGNPRPTEVERDAGFSHINALPVLPSDDKTMTRNLLAFGWDLNKITQHRSVSDSSYPIDVQSHVLSSGALAGAEGKVINMHGIRPISSIEDAIGDVNFQAPQITATITAARDPLMSCDTHRITVASRTDNENNNGWLMFDEPLPGEFFTIQLEYEDVQDELLREIIGWQVDCEIGSTR